jgi:hypothetical protein
MFRTRGLVFVFAILIVFALGTATLPVLGAEGISMPPVLQPPSGTVHGPVGTIVNGNFNGPALNLQNSVEATVKYELDTAQTGQVYVAIADQALLPRRILGVENIHKGLGSVMVRFSLACTPGAPVMTTVHKIEFGINRFGPPRTAPLKPIQNTQLAGYEFACPMMQAPTNPVMQIPTKAK